MATIAHSVNLFRWKEYVGDVVVLGIGISLGLLGLKVSISDSFWSSTQSNGNQQLVGYLVGGAGAVRVRPHGSWVWRDLSRNERVSLSEGDAIFTGSDGSASVELKSAGAVLKLSPNSLISIRNQEEDTKSEGWTGWARLLSSAPVQPKVEVASGQVKVEMQKGSKGLNLASRDKQYRIEGGEKVSALAFKVLQNEAPRIDVLNKDATGLKVQEQAARQMAANQKAVEERADAWDNFFTGAAEELAVSAPIASLGTTTTSEIGGDQKAVERVDTLQGFFPKDGDILRLDSLDIDGRGALTFRWETSEQLAAGGKVLIEWQSAQAEDERGSFIAFSDDLAHRVALLPGPYRWRASPMSTEGKTVDSKWQKFTLLFLPAPTQVTPLNEYVAMRPSSGTTTSVLEFVWKSMSGENIETEIEISDDLGSMKVVRTPKSEAEFPLRSGEYTWRVRLVKWMGIVSYFSEWSPTRKIYVPGRELVAPVESVLPDLFDEEAYDLEAVPDAEVLSPKKVVPTLKIAANGLSSRLKSIEDLDEVKVKLQWNAIPDAEKYIVEVFRANVAEPTRKEVTEPSLDLKIDPSQEAEYAYRISTVLPDMEPISSKKVTVRIALESPMLKFPAKGAVLPANEFSTMTWEKTLFTEQYELLIATDEKFKKLKDRHFGKDNFHILKYSEPGTYYWKVRSVGKTRSSDWSDIRSFKIRSQGQK